MMTKKRTMSRDEMKEERMNYCIYSLNFDQFIINNSNLEFLFVFHRYR